MYGPFNMHNSHHKTKGQKFKTFFLSQGIDIVAKWTELLSQGIYIYIYISFGNIPTTIHS
jgi:hypothetical protein